MESEETGMSTGVAMLIGAGLTVAAAAAVKLGKKLVAKFRAKKALEYTTDARDFVLPSDEVIDYVCIKHYLSLFLSHSISCLAVPYNALRKSFPFRKAIWLFLRNLR